MSTDGFDWDGLLEHVSAATARQKRWRDKRRAAGLSPRSSGEAAKRGDASTRPPGLSRRAARGESMVRDFPFAGVDGEGGGTDEQGRQNYLLLRAGDRELWHQDGRRLTTWDCLGFLCDLPRTRLYVGFGFDYDATQILRDIDPAKLKLILMGDKEREAAGHPGRYVYVGGFGIEYVRRKYLRVCRLDAEGERAAARTVYETHGFFQTSFVNALARFGIGTAAERETIAAMKGQRDGFGAVTDEIRDYNARECDMLAELMETLRGHCATAGIVPKRWTGAGELAAAMHTAHGTPRRLPSSGRKGILDLVPLDVRQMARRAYYGGRFEITRIGEIAGPVHAYDIRSAYPAAMLRLPCLECGTWEACDGPQDGLHVSEVSYSHPAGAALCGLPHRAQDGRLRWQRFGQGVYWSPEIEAARSLGATVTVGQGWRYVCHCSHTPLKWVGHYYAERRRIIAEMGDAAGIPMKLGINSLYGKLAQRVGSAPFGNMIWAGLITAMTRAELMAAAGTAARLSDVLYIATDALYSLSPLGVRIGTELGEWEAKQLPGVHIVQPGLYWSTDREAAAKLRLDKSRGIPSSILRDAVPQFTAAWQSYVSAPSSVPWPRVTVGLRNYIGLRLAMARGKPETAGRWTDETRTISYDCTAKRQRGRWQGQSLLTTPHRGNAADVSKEHPEDADDALLASVSREFADTFGALADAWTFGPPDSYD